MEMDRRNGITEMKNDSKTLKEETQPVWVTGSQKLPQNIKKLWQSLAEVEGRLPAPSPTTEENVQTLQRQIMVRKPGGRHRGAESGGWGACSGHGF